MGNLKCTPLRDFHIAHGGRMVDFAGWEMPVQYRSILEEHKAVRRTAGLFDVSHMGEVDIRGPDAGRFLNHLVTNDVSRLFAGRVLYSPMCYPTGGVVDDLLIYMRGAEDFFLCINAGNIDKDLAWMREQTAGFNVTITDRSLDYAQLAVQGPKAATIVQALTSVRLDLVKYYHFTEGTVAGLPCLISRTGYTGEDGFELYHAAEGAPRLAEALLAAGAPHGLELAGLGARDSLRLEAGYPLYGHEITAEVSPLAAGLNWTVKFDKGANPRASGAMPKIDGGTDFIGRDALLLEKVDGSPFKVVFFKTGDRRIVRATSLIYNSEGQNCGHVLSGTLSPILNEAIGSALVATALTAQPLVVDIRGAKIGLQLVKPPFVPLKKM
jgi:aminomethyltransferase